jgi:hypothetical protein
MKEIMKAAVHSPAVTKKEPIKFNISIGELETALEFAKAGKKSFITMRVTKTGLGPIVEVSLDYDGKFTDITNYEAF